MFSQAALSTAALQLNTVMDGGGPPRDDMRIPGGAVDSIPKQTVRFPLGNLGIRIYFTLIIEIVGMQNRELILQTPTEIHDASNS